MFCLCYDGYEWNTYLACQSQLVKRNFLLCYFHECITFWYKQLDHVRYKNTCCSRLSNWFLDHTSDSIYLTKEKDNYKYLKLIYCSDLDCTYPPQTEVRFSLVTMRGMISWVVMQYSPV
jgi:hypothetical protein